MKNLLQGIGLAMATILTLSSCGIAKGKKEVEARAKIFLDERIANGGCGDDKYYHPEFLKTTKEKWPNIKTIVNGANGNLKSYKLVNWNLKFNKSTNKLVHGTTATLVFQTEYEKSKGTETIKWLRSKKGSDFMILAHNFNSPEIQAAMDKGTAMAAEEAAKEIEAEKNEKQ